jgi:predicted metal-dependent enzyme (double-stranded beta helix superfamily)
MDVDRFVADCRDAAAATGSIGVLEVVAKAVAAPSDVLRSLGEPQRAGVNVLYRSAEITVFNLIWGPWMCLLPHNHGMWALIGIYTGREDNIFWRRPVPSTGRIEAAGARALSEREAMPLGPEIIHSVINPIKRLTGAIHVYGGDFFAVSRSEWDPEHLVEGPYDVAKTLALFEESNRIYPEPPAPDFTQELPRKLLPTRAKEAQKQRRENR